MITAVPINEIQLRSGKIVNKGKPTVIIEEETPKEQIENHIQQ